MTNKKQLKKQMKIHLTISISLFLMASAIALTNESIDYFSKLRFNISLGSAMGITTLFLLLTGIYLMWSILTRASLKIENLI